MGLPLPLHLYQPHSNIAASSPGDACSSQSQDERIPISNLETLDTFGKKLYDATFGVLAQYPDATQIPRTKAIISIRVQNNTGRMNRHYLRRFAMTHNEELDDSLCMDVLGVFPGSRSSLVLFVIPYEASSELVHDCYSFRIIDIVERENVFSIEDWY